MKSLEQRKLERLTKKNMSYGLSEELAVLCAKQEIENDNVAFVNKMQKMTNPTPEHFTKFDGIHVR